MVNLRKVKMEWKKCTLLIRRQPDYVLAMGHLWFTRSRYDTVNALTKTSLTRPLNSPRKTIFQQVDGHGRSWRGNIGVENIVRHVTASQSDAGLTICGSGTPTTCQREAQSQNRTEIISPFLCAQQTKAIGRTDATLLHAIHYA
jgi:hypothetical protein